MKPTPIAFSFELPSTLLGVLSVSLLAACSDGAGGAPHPSEPSEPPGTAFEDGEELSVAVPESGRVYVDLAGLRVVSPDDPGASTEWDLAFEGFDVFTNGGASGSAGAAAFGPLDVSGFLGETAPEVPFFTEDRAGGAFLGWYEYDGQSHSLWSRYHTYGVRDGDALWKVQILTYYGKRDGAVIPAIYGVRYAAVAPEPGETVQLLDLDGTAGGTAASGDAASECLDLGTGERPMHTVAQALESADWHLCFRRDAISVNGEKGGPRGASAVDLDAAETANERLSALMNRTADSESARFESIDAAAFEGRRFRGDRIASAFGDEWTEDSMSKAWLVRAASGSRKFLIAFSQFSGTTASSPGTILLYVKPVKG